MNALEIIDSIVEKLDYIYYNTGNMPDVNNAADSIYPQLVALIAYVKEQEQRDE